MRRVGIPCAALMVMSLMLAACGQKGPLFLPPPDAPTVPAATTPDYPAPTPVTAAEVVDPMPTSDDQKTESTEP